MKVGNICAILAVILILSPVLRAPCGAESGPASSIPPVHVIEDHSELLPLFVHYGLRNVSVLHIDAHDDLWPPPSDKQVESAGTLVGSGRIESLKASGRYFAPWKEHLYGINNHLVLAHRLGLIKKVYWAIPTFGSMDNGALADFRLMLAASQKFEPGEVDRLRIAPPLLVGTLSGVPLTVGSLKDFPRAESPWVLDVDIDFFPPLYRNPVSSSYSGILAGFVEWVRKQPPPAFSVLAYSHNGGYLPLSLRYLGRWLRDLLQNPALLDASPPKPWVLKEEAVHLEYFDQFDKAEDIYRQILRESPDDPDASYSIAMLQLQKGDVDGAIASLSSAYRLDNAYFPGFLQVSSVLEKAGRSDDSLKVLNAAASLAPGNVSLNDALGNHYHNRRDYPSAIRHYRKVVEAGRPSPLTHAYLGDSYLLSGKPEEAEQQYLAAIRLYREHPDTELPSRYWLSLGEVRESLGRPAEARAAYQELLARPSLDPDTVRIVKERLERILSLPTSP